MINSSNQELIHYIYCFGCTFCNQCKTMKFCWFHMLLFYDLYIEFYSSNVSNISYSTKHLYIHYDLLSQQHFYELLSLWLIVATTFFCRFTLILFLKFSTVFPHTTLFINLYNVFHLFLFLFFFVCWIQHIVLAIEIDWIGIEDIYFLVAIIILSKVAIFHYESHIFLCQKLVL